MDDKQRRSVEPERLHPVAEALPQVKSPKSEAARQYKAHQKAITQGLRQFFDAVAAEPVPEEFKDLLKKLDDEKTDGGA
ncbi:MAG: hypothetical protein KGJ78_13830 [Alphaproteobacteria bacterium]|nr:hypothetical protein [Alphaproteobacteria bacterium]